MKLLPFLNKDENVRSREIAFQGGAYSLAVTAVVLAILVVVNILASVLPPAATKLDISAAKLYSITSNTKTVVNSLDKDVTIYWIVQADQENKIIENLLSKYDSLSEHIKIIKKNPDAHPTFAAKYTDKEIKNNSLVVECDDRSRYISFDDIYVANVDYTTYTATYSFDGEGAVTSAIDYVVSQGHPKVYVLEGHGEAAFSPIFSNQMEKDNIERKTFSLLNQDAIPKDADCILIHVPSTDISQEEKDLLAKYVSSGGKLMVMAGPTKDGTLKNLYSLLSDYGISASDGVVVEGSRDHYAFQMPYIMLPNLQSHKITDSLLDGKYRVIAPIAQGLTVGSTNGGSVKKLLTTSDDAFSKTAGYNIETYEKESGDVDGPFALAVSVEAKNGGSIIWISSSKFLDEQFNAFSSGANLNFTMNALASLLGDREAVSIRSKPLNYNYLTINDSTASLIKTVMIGILPLAFAAMGIAVVVDRRKKRNEQS